MDCQYVYAVKGDKSSKFDKIKMKEHVRKSDFSF